MLSLVWRQVKKTATVQIALAVLFASAVTVFLIYSSYIARENTLTGARIVSRIPSQHVLVENQAPTPIAVGSTPALSLAGSWQQANLASNLGELPCVLIGGDSPLTKIAPAGSIVVERGLAQRLGLDVGSQVVLYDRGHPFTVEVNKIYSSNSETQGFDFGDKVLVFTGQVQINSHYLYRIDTNNLTWAITTLSRYYPNANVVDAASDVTLGTLVAKSTAAIVAQSKMSLVFFVAIAFLTAKVLGFMDNRRTLAILKAIGLKHNEVARFMFLDAIISPLAGAIVGGVLGRCVLTWFENRGAGLSFTATILFQAITALIPAIAVGVYVPSRFAKMASVNQLALERSIPLFYEKVDSLKRRWPALDPYVAQGVQFIKLEVIEGAFEGYIFRHLGDAVRKGEVLASDTSWWGLKSREYVAPISGTVVFFEPTTGVLGIGPAEVQTVVQSIMHSRLTLASAGQDN